MCKYREAKKETNIYGGMYLDCEMCAARDVMRAVRRAIWTGALPTSSGLSCGRVHWKVKQSGDNGRSWWISLSRTKYW